MATHTWRFIAYPNLIAGFFDLFSCYALAEFRPLQMGRDDSLHPKACFMLRPHTLKRNFSGNSAYSQPGEHGEIKVLTTEDLSSYTNGFSEANNIGNFQSGKLYHGNIDGRKVTVKIWEDTKIYYFSPTLNKSRLRDELDLLQHPELLAQPYAVKVIGYCHEEECIGIVYDVESIDSVRNLIFKDSFTWLHRIKVIVGFACFLSFLHAPHPPHCCYLVRNIDAKHIMVDQDYNPKLIDFGMITGGIFPDRTKDNNDRKGSGCYGYIDMGRSDEDLWAGKSDVYAFGILILSMIVKRVYKIEESSRDAQYVDEWAEKEYEARMLESGVNETNISLVHQSLEGDKDLFCDDGAKITMLAFKCVDCYAGERPSINQVIKELLGLRVVQLHAHELGIGQMLRNSSAC